MKIVCDTCGRTGSGTRDSLIDKGWRKVVITSPLRKTFTGCPDHARMAPEAAIAAIMAYERDNKKNIVIDYDRNHGVHPDSDEQPDRTDQGGQIR